MSRLDGGRTREVYQFGACRALRGTVVYGFDGRTRLFDREEACSYHLLHSLVRP